LKKSVLRSFGLLGLLLFFPLFLFTFSDPYFIEKSAKAFIEWKLKSETNKKIDSIQLPQSKSIEKFLRHRVNKIRQETEQKLEILKKQLKNDAPKIIVTQLAKMRDLSCKCREKWKERLRSFLIFKIDSLEKARERLADFAQAKYMEIVEKLTLDVRIFLGTNSLIFLFLLLASFLRPKTIDHLFLPALLMLVSTIVCAYFYLFEQNWFYTIIYNNYTGFGYIAYLVIVFAILCDIVFNKAKVTTKVINWLLNAIGTTFSVASC